MGAPGFDLASLLPMLKAMVSGQGGNVQPLGPQSATGDMLASAGGGMVAADPSTMEAPGAGGGVPPTTNQGFNPADLAKYAMVMKGIQKSNERPPVGREASPMLNLRSSADPKLTPISPVSRPPAGPQSVGAMLASPEGRRLIASLEQMNQGMGA